MKRRKLRHSQRAALIKNLFILGVSFTLFVSGFFIVWASTLNLPSFDTFQERKVAESTKIYDRTGKIVLYDIHQDIKRKVVSFDDMSRYVKNATVAIEDSEFYNHIGIRPLAFLRAVIVNLIAHSYEQGGSTITQQVIKNTLLTPEKTITRKLKEWVLALKLERVMSKDEILGIYLNEAPYGGNIYGIEEASQSFFGKPAKDLDLAESAYLAALPQAPTYYSPYGNNADKLKERKNLVLSRMLELKFISQNEYDQAKNEEVEFLPQESFGIKAPHFVIWVRQYLEQKYGKDAIENGGYKVITTLDYDLQKKAETIVSEYAPGNEAKFNAHNAGIIGIDPKTGQILVMVGSRDYFETENDGNFNVTLSHRQPGSSFKPFVYATALAQGYTTETTVFDLRTQFQTTCDAEGRPLSSEVDPNDCYMPENYDHVYRGPVTFREALAQSINIPAIKALYLVGIKNALSTAQKLGITSLTNANQYGLTLVLGGGEVSLLEMTSAYGVFANEGKRDPYTSILRVEDRDGNVLEEYHKDERQVIDQNVALSISDMLSDNVARTPAFGARSPLYFDGRDVASKTGTTNDYRDAWIIGYTPSFALGAWVGNNDNTSMEKKVAGFVVAPMWHDIMAAYLASTTPETFPDPEPLDKTIKPVLRGIWEGSETYTIDKASGLLATQYTPDDMREDKVVTNVHSILYWVNKDDPRGAFPQNPGQDPQFTLWETPVRKWVASQHIVENDRSAIPTSSDNVHLPNLVPIVTITSPAANTVVSANQRMFITLTAQGKFPLSRADFFLNDRFVGSSKTYPFKFSFIPNEMNIGLGVNKLTVVVYDSVLNKTITEQTFVVQ